MDEVIIRYIDPVDGAHAFVMRDQDDCYNVYADRTISKSVLRSELGHELIHIAEHHVRSDMDVYDCETAVKEIIQNGEPLLQQILAEEIPEEPGISVLKISQKRFLVKEIC